MSLSGVQENKRIEYDYSDAPTLEAFAASNARVRGVMGPFGSGKSTACVMEIIQRSMAQAPGPDGIRRTRWAVVRNTYPQLQDTTIKTFFDWFPPEFCGKYHDQKHNYLITKLKGCLIDIMFRALDRPDHVKNLLSLEITGAWGNEAREIPEAIIDGLDGRIGRYPAMKDGGCTWKGIFMDTNPPEDGSWWHRKFEVEKPANWEIFKQPSGVSASAENRNHLIPNYYEELMQGKSKEWINVYVHGNYGFIVEGEPVTPEYNPGVHHANYSLPVIPGATGFRFWDGGLNPTCIIGQITPSGRLHFIDGLILPGSGMKQLVVSQVMPLMSMKYGMVDEWLDFGDPTLATKDQGNSESVPARIIETHLGTSFVGSEHWPVTREASKNALNLMIDGRPFVLIGKECDILHKALLGGWHYPKTATGRVVHDKPLKNVHSHPADCFGMGMIMLMGKPKTAAKKLNIKASSMRSYA
jgi:hypothetical protein